MPSFPGVARVLRAALFEDWLLKLICLALAALMWFYIDGELTDRRDLVVALRPSDVGLPPGFALSPAHPLPKFVVLVRGPRRRLQLISADSIAFERKMLNEPRPGPNLLKVEPGDLRAEGFEVLDVSPKQETLELVSTVQREKVVRVKTSGAPRKGFVAEAGTAEPNKVVVEGDSGDLAELEHVWTQEVDIANAEQDVVREVGIEPSAEAGGRRVPVRCATKVRATVLVHPEQVAKRMTLDVRPLALPGTAMTIEPPTVEVEVEAEARELAAPELKSGIILFADWPGTWERPKDETTVLGPQRVQVRAFAPPRVHVRGVNGAALPTVEVRGALGTVLLQRRPP